MASATFAEVRARFDAYAREISAPRQDLSYVPVDRMVRWSAILRDTETFLADAAKFPDPYADDLENLIAWVTLLRQAVARLLAAAGPVLKDQAHTDALNLTSEQAEFIADLLNTPLSPTMHSASRRANIVQRSGSSGISMPGEYDWEPFNATFDRASFTCGEEFLDQ